MNEALHFNVRQRVNKNQIEYKVMKTEKIRNHYNQIPHLTKDTIWENDKTTRKHYMHRSQEVSFFSAGDHKVTRNIQDSMTEKHAPQKTKMIHKRSTTLERPVRNILEGFNMFDGTNLTLISDVQ